MRAKVEHIYSEVHLVHVRANVDLIRVVAKGDFGLVRAKGDGGGTAQHLHQRHGCGGPGRSQALDRGETQPL